MGNRRGGGEEGGEFICVSGVLCACRFLMYIVCNACDVL